MTILSITTTKKKLTTKVDGKNSIKALIGAFLFFTVFSIHSVHASTKTVYGGPTLALAGISLGQNIVVKTAATRIISVPDGSNIGLSSSQSTPISIDASSITASLTINTSSLLRNKTIPLLVAVANIPTSSATVTAIGNLAVINGGQYSVTVKPSDKSIIETRGSGSSTIIVDATACTTGLTISTTGTSNVSVTASPNSVAKGITIQGTEASTVTVDAASWTTAGILTNNNTVTSVTAINVPLISKITTAGISGVILSNIGNFSGTIVNEISENGLFLDGLGGSGLTVSGSGNIFIGNSSYTGSLKSQKFTGNVWIATTASSTYSLYSSFKEQKTPSSIKWGKSIIKFSSPPVITVNGTYGTLIVG